MQQDIEMRSVCCFALDFMTGDNNKQVKIDTVAEVS
jgi:hypothetical protein